MHLMIIFIYFAARIETAREKQLKEEKKILESVAEKTGKTSSTFYDEY